MKVIFGINHPAASTHYVEYASLAIASARQVGYEPVLLYDGESPPIDVEKIECRSRFSQEMRAALRPDEYRIAAGAMLRLEIPFLFDDEYVLYTDVDVLFLRRLELPTVAHWGMVPENRAGSHFNSGVSVMHVPELRETAPGFDAFCRQAILAGRLPSLCWDQGLINAFYSERITKLPDIWNWRPYWGPNPEAAILHFHGPKPLDSQARIDQEYPASLRPPFFYAAKQEWLDRRNRLLGY